MAPAASDGAALIPLGLYFAASVLRLATSSQLTAAAWLASPVAALLVILFVLAGLAHMLVGVRSVFLDYVHTRARLLFAELLLRAATAILAGGCTARRPQASTGGASCRDRATTSTSSQPWAWRYTRRRRHG